LIRKVDNAVVHLPSYSRGKITQLGVFEPRRQISTPRRMTKRMPAIMRISLPVIDISPF